VSSSTAHALRLAALASLAIAGWVVAAVAVFADRDGAPETAGCPIASPPMTEAAVGAPGRAAEQSYLGVILARLATDVSPRFDGRLLAVHVRLGDRVAAGAPIATLDVPTVRFGVPAAEAALAAATVEHDKAAAELADAKERLERREQLAAGSLLSPEELSIARHQHAIARASVEAARAQLAERRTQLEKALRDAEDAVIRAPFAGVIATRYADPGSNVSPSTRIVRLIGGGDMLARFAVPENRAAKLEVGRNVVVRVGERGAAMRGQVEKVAPEVDAASRMIIVEAALESDEAGPRVISGELARVHFEEAR
jgi:RND family efflux transporter MFP subunit